MLKLDRSLSATAHLNVTLSNISLPPMENFEVERLNVLTRDIYYQAMQSLHADLPSPVTDDPDELARRDNAAMAEVASLIPANAEEVKLAVLFVTASAHATDILSVERGPAMDAAKRWTQSTSMMRQATGARSLLLRVQAVRLKREASNPATDAAAWIEYNALNHMARALGRSWAGPPEETPAVDVNAPADPPAAELPPQSIPDLETKSQLSANETTARRDTPDSSILDDPHSVLVAPAGSEYETESRLSGNETVERRGGTDPATDDASRLGLMPSHPVQMPTAPQSG